MVYVALKHLALAGIVGLAVGMVLSSGPWATNAEESGSPKPEGSQSGAQADGSSPGVSPESSGGIAFYASGYGQIFISSAWIGKTRRVAQIDKGPLPLNYKSNKYPGPTSAARLEIAARVNDWVSLAAIFEPIADDGRAFVVSDSEHPYMGQFKERPDGEWLNNRRAGSHAFIVGTTHNTGATAGALSSPGTCITSRVEEDLSSRVRTGPLFALSWMTTEISRQKNSEAPAKP